MSSPAVTSRSTLTDLLALQPKVLRQHLEQHELATSGTRPTLAKRLHAHLQASTRAPPTRMKTTGPKRKAPKKASSRAKSSGVATRSRTAATLSGSWTPRHREPRRSSPDSSLSSDTTSQSPERRRKRPASKRHARRARQRGHLPSTSSSSDTDSATSTNSERSRPTQRRKRQRHSSSTSSSTVSTDSSESSHARRGRHRHRRCWRTRSEKRDRKSHRTPSSSSDSEADLFDTSPYLSFRAPPPRTLRKRIARGKFVHFNTLLQQAPAPAAILNQAIQPYSAKKTPTRSHRRVTDLPTWLEAWNTYAAIRCATHPSLALELLKYQAIMCMLFSTFPPHTCIEYDRLFRHLISRDPTQRWDTLKDDLFLFNAAQPSFRAPRNTSIHTRLGPPSHTDMGRQTRTPSGAEICRRYNFDRCTLGDECKFTHVCWKPGCGGPHPGKRCPAHGP